MRRIHFIAWGIASFVVVAITQPVPGNGQIPPSSQNSDSHIIPQPGQLNLSDGWVTAQADLCNSATVTSPTTVTTSHDGSPYQVWTDFRRGKESINPAACGRQYWLKEDPSHYNNGIKFVYLVDGRGVCIVPFLYRENSDGSLESLRPAPECSAAQATPQPVTPLAQLSLTGHWLESGQGRGRQRMEIIQNGNVLNLLLSYPTGDYTQQATLSGNQFQFECKFNNPGSATDFHYSYIGTFSTDGNIIDLTEQDKTGRNSNRNMRLPRTAEVQVEQAGSQPCSSEVTPKTIEEKRAFRKSDQQVAAELAALRERGKREGWTFEIGDSQAFRILLELLNGTRIPANFRPNTINILDILTRLIQEASRNNPTPVPPQPVPPRPIPNPNQLPNRFDAREWGVVPEIRTQGGCGSCWAFAAVSAQEIAYSSLYQQPSGSLNLSEQQLLSCNRNNFSCGGGFISDKDSDYRYESGLVGEQAYPYEERQSTCRNFSRPGSGNLFDIKAFQFIDLNDDLGSPANITKIKQAIYAYGVVWAGVYADDEAFHAYKGGGVFNACSNTPPRHAINIIGWDDAGGYWIVRNSWGNDWGENGYMKIKYGCNHIGANAAIPKLPVLADCNGGNCQPRNYSTPPWLGGNAPNPVPPTPAPPNSVPPTYVPPASNPNPPNNIPPGYNW